MSKLQDIATTSANNYASSNDNHLYAFDPATILALLEIVKQVMDMFKDCKQPANTAITTIKNPGLFARMRLRSIVRDNMSRADFRNHGEQIIEALQKTGKDLTVEDLKDVL